MKNICFTKHARQKFEDLQILGIEVTEFQIIQILLNPDSTKTDFGGENTIVTGSFGIDKVLRVVYRLENDKMIVITFYPARKNRYI